MIRENNNWFFYVLRAQPGMVRTPTGLSLGSRSCSSGSTRALRVVARARQARDEQVEQSSIVSPRASRARDFHRVYMSRTRLPLWLVFNSSQLSRYCFHCWSIRDTILTLVRLSLTDLSNRPNPVPRRTAT